MSLTALRTAAEKTLIDTCAVTRAGAGDPTLDRDTGVLTPDDDDPIWAGPCSTSPLNDRVSLIGDRQEVLARYRIRFPILAAGIQVGDVVTVTAVDPVDGDPDLVGARFVIDAPTTSRVLRRFVATRVLEGEGIAR